MAMTPKSGYRIGRLRWRRPKSVAEKLADETYRAHRNARRANKKRYRQGLRELRRGYGQAAASVGQIGQANMEDVRQTYDEWLGKIQANVAGGRMTGSTVGPTMELGAIRERNRAMRHIGENMMQNQAGVAMQGAEGVAGFIERRNDVGPDLSRIAQLQMQLGAAGPGFPIGRPIGPVNQGTGPFQVPPGAWGVMGNQRMGLGGQVPGRLAAGVPGAAGGGGRIRAPRGGMRGGAGGGAVNMVDPEVQAAAAAFFANGGRNQLGGGNVQFVDPNHQPNLQQPWPQFHHPWSPYDPRVRSMPWSKRKSGRRMSGRV